MQDEYCSFKKRKLVADSYEEVSLKTQGEDSHLQAKAPPCSWTSGLLSWVMNFYSSSYRVIKWTML